MDGPRHKEEELLAYFDSVSKLDPIALGLAARAITDSALFGFTSLMVDLDGELWSAVMSARKNGRMARAAYEALAVLDGDTTAFVDPKVTGDSVHVIVHVQGLEGRQGWRHTILEVADSSHWGASELYFFHGHRLVAQDGVFHRYGLDLEMLKTRNGRSIVSYRQTFCSGAGANQSNRFFYGLDGDTLRPLANLIQMAGCSFGPKWWDIQGTAKEQDPYAVKYILTASWGADMDTVMHIAEDSIVFIVNWEERWALGYPESMTNAEARLWSYQVMETVSFDDLFIRTHHEEILRELNDPSRRPWALSFLDYALKESRKELANQ